MPVTITLGGVTLSPHMVWVDRDAAFGVQQTRLRTLGGKQVVYTQALSKGQEITLEAQSDTGWLTKAQVDAMLGLAQTPGAIYVFDYDGTTYNVIFRHDDPPAVDFTPIVYRNNQEATDYFTGVLKLVTV